MDPKVARSSVPFTLAITLKREEDMRKIAVLCVVAALIGVAGCSRKSTDIVAPKVSNLVNGMVTDSGEALAGSSILVMLESGRDIELTADVRGQFSTVVPDDERVVGVAAAASGRYGIVVTGLYADLQIVTEEIPVTASRASPSTVMQDLWYGVYDTNSSGDVRFRYQYTFSRFYCINWMSNLFPYTISPDPNRWTSWDLTDFSSPWKGKKLLVPSRYRWWHGAVYGYSISQALVLIATR